MPWSIKTNAEGCNGFAVVKDGTNVPIAGGCHKTRRDAYKHLVALRLAYSERAFSPDQPRGPDGKFLSTGGSDDTGGGGSKAPTPAVVKKGGTYKAGDKPGSKVKSAPNNVTSKGVNPNSEYVLSQKTGNFFANPQYNGNPEGKGKYSPNGKNKAQQGSIDELDGGAKYLATGQAKFKDSSTGAGRPQTATPKPAVGKMKVGKVPDGYVKGRVIDPLKDEKDGEMALKAVKNRYGNGDLRLEGVLKEQGFNGKPMVLKTQSEVDELVAQGWKPVYRGTAHDDRGRSYSTEFAEGEFYAGLGIYGNGTYTSTFRSTAESYAGNRYHGRVPKDGGPNARGGMNEILIAPDAVVSTYGEISSLRQGYMKEVQTARDALAEDYTAQLAVVSKTGKISDIPEADYNRITADFRAKSEVIDAAEKLAGDEGRFAAMMGIDAYVVPNQGQRYTPTGKGKGKVEIEDYVVIVNRTAVATRVIRP